MENTVNSWPAGRLQRNNDFITPGGRFPRLTKKDSKARLKEIKKLLLALWIPGSWLDQ